MVAMTQEQPAHAGIADFSWCSSERTPPMIPSAPALPTLLDPELIGAAELPTVAADAKGYPEPLVRLIHPRIRTCGVYFHAGVAGTVGDTWVREGVAERFVRRRIAAGALGSRGVGWLARPTHPTRAAQRRV